MFMQKSKLNGFLLYFTTDEKNYFPDDIPVHQECVETAFVCITFFAEGIITPENVCRFVNLCNLLKHCPSDLFQ